MADEQFIIELKADVSGLQPTIDLLEKLGKIDAATAEQFKKAAAAFQAHDKALTASKKSFQDVGAESEKAGKKISDTAKRSNKDLSDLSATIKGIGAAIGIGLGTAALKSFGEEAVKEFSEAEKAARALSFTLTEVLGASNEEIDLLINQAVELSKTTFFSKAQIQQAQNVFAQFGANAEQTKRLIDVTKELAATPSFDNNIVAASQAVVDAIKGRGTALKELGITLKSNTTESEKLAEVTEKLSKLDGTLADALNTTEGRLLNQKKRIDDLKESIGEQLAPVLLNIKESFLQAFIPPKAVSDFENFIDKIKKQAQDARSAQSLPELQDNLNLLKNRREELLKLGSDRTKQQTEELNLLTKNIESLRIYIAQREQALRVAKDEFELTSDVEGKSIEQLRLEIELIKKRSDANTVDARSAVSVREDQIERLIKLSEKQREKELRDAQDIVKAQAELRKFALQSELDNIEEERVARSSQAALTISDSKELQDRLVIIEFEALQKRIAIKREFAEATSEEENRITELVVKATQERNEAIKKSMKDGLDRLLKGTKSIQDAIDDVIKLESDLSKKSFAELLQIIRIARGAGLQGLDDIKAAQEEIRRRFVSIVETLASIGGEIGQIFNNITQQRINDLEEIRDKQQENFDAESDALKEKLDRDLISQAQYENELSSLKKRREAEEKRIEQEIRKLKREQAERDKAFAIFDIILKTAIAITSASATLNPVLVALVAALGAAQLAKVISTPIPKFHTGKLAETDSSEQHAIIRRDETVLSPENSRQYRTTLEAIHRRKIPASMLNEFVRLNLDKMPKHEDSKIQFPEMLNERGVRNAMKRGFPVTNPNDIAQAIINVLPKENPRRRI